MAPRRPLLVRPQRTRSLPPPAGAAFRGPHLRRILVAVAVLTLVSTACRDKVPRDASGNLTGPVAMSVFDLRVGDCFDRPTAENEVGEVNAMPCSLPHDNEVFAIATHPSSGQQWPGLDAIQQSSQGACATPFEDFVGRAAAASELEFAYFTPNEKGWEKGDDEVVCFLFAQAGERLEASMRGSGK